ncbi:MAG: aminotransferase class I/II-fold pyridoxal phosphate-dependent enzyme [Oscillospiraceae bacterium]|jgi:DNA-binding transcriptional MocR family regulator|nr:aminotransferase class I/II-fold pyridoxal phosphate-dependent enzyme [Oscillospiraceae bacterium]
MNYFQTNFNDLKDELETQLKTCKKFSEGLFLDISRGKPSQAQLDLSSALLDVGHKNLENNIPDVRNYGNLEGIPEAQKLMAILIGCQQEDVIIGGNSSLSLMFDVISCFFIHGIDGNPWCNQKIKFLCPSPGYDRHFSICEYFGIEMIPIKVNDDGPDIERIKNLVKNDQNIKGIWCVPKYSNPSGIIYSDHVVKELANLSPAASDFRIFWDNAYSVHDLMEPSDLFDIFYEISKNQKNELVIAFSSMSKVTFAGSGISALACRGKNLELLKKYYSFKTIGFDKINQLRHVKFFGKDKNFKQNLKLHMRKHAEILRPKFNLVHEVLEFNFKNNPIISWSKPGGGYFICVNTFGSAKRVVDLCAENGLKLTPAGVMFPYGIDLEDSTIRIAPSYSSLEELKKALEIFCACVKISALEKLLKMRR